MEEQSPTGVQEDGIELEYHVSVLRETWWKILLLSVLAGLVTLLVTFRMPDRYQATAIIAPSVDEKKQNPAFGALATFIGDVGGPSKVEDLETLFKSNDLTVRVFGKYNHWPTILEDQFDPSTGKMRVRQVDSLLGLRKDQKVPGDWDAIRAAADRLKVSVNKKAGTVTVSFESTSMEGSANIVKNYLEEGKSRLQEEAFERANKNKKFIEEQIGRTIDALTRDRLYSLFGQEVEREMLARNREQFGFRIVDSPRVPDRKSRPQRVGIALTVMVLSLPINYLVFAAMLRKRQSGGNTR